VSLKLRARIRVIWIAITVVMTFGSFFGARAMGWDPVKLALILLLPLLLALLAVQVTQVRGAQRRLTQAFATENFSAMRHELLQLIDYFRDQPRMREVLRMAEASALVAEEKYAEARAVLESIDQAILGEEALPTIQNNLAFCMAQLGEVDAAIEMSRAAVGRAEGQSAGTVANLLGTLGMCYVQAGRAGEAVPLLQKALGRGAQAQPVQRYGQAIRAYYLGEALLAEGRKSEANEAFDRAVKEAPGTRYARRAQEKRAAAGVESPKE
jgi:tetratricopeptide (TPR) repeat protein